jgi:hypothetical protein
MKVWLLFWCFEHEGDTLLGVYASEEAAKAAALATDYKADPQWGITHEIREREVVE